MGSFINRSFANLLPAAWLVNTVQPVVAASATPQAGEALAWSPSKDLDVFVFGRPAKLRTSNLKTRASATVPLSSNRALTLRLHLPLARPPKRRPSSKKPRPIVLPVPPVAEPKV